MGPCGLRPSPRSYVNRYFHTIQHISCYALPRCCTLATVYTASTWTLGMPKLTQQFVDRATAPAKGQRFFRDVRVQGLALRVTSGGAKAWVWEGRVRGRVRRITLGPHPALSLAVARDEALAMA